MTRQRAPCLAAMVALACALHAPTVPHPGVAAKGAAGKLGRRAMPNVAAPR